MEKVEERKIVEIKEKADTIKVSEKRDSNLELFRIFLMLLIVAHHYVVNSGILDKIYTNVNPSNAYIYIYILLDFWSFWKNRNKLFFIYNWVFYVQEKNNFKEVFEIVF